MRLADSVTPHDLKQINLQLLLEGAKQVGGGRPLAARVRSRAKMVRDDRLQELLDEIPGVNRNDVPMA